MPQYFPVALYNYTDGAFIGYAIKAVDGQKLQSTNIWREGEEHSLNERLDDLNTDHTIRTLWPSQVDPDVQALLNDPTWEPIEMIDHQVVDEERSHIVYLEVPEVDVAGTPTGKMRQTDEPDPMASVLNYKTVKAPARPSDQVMRINKACETVARRRAGMVQ